jgi:xanthine dehydrogenase YagS FAD-binding subunit
MMIKDVIPGFELYRPTTIADAVALLDEHKKEVWKLAGGNDSLSWFKDRIKRPKVVIELSGIAEMKGVKETEDGIEIGALTTLSDIEKDPIITKSYKLLVEAAGKVASPQIRNTGTIGGNVSQDARCWYYRSGLPCYRAGGNTCFSDTPEGQNREHAIFDANRCVAVSQSDMAPTMIALDAKMVIHNAKGERVVNAEEFFVGPKIDITRLTQLQPEDLLVAIRIPKEWAGARFYFEKVTDRFTWDFALVNVAAAVKTDAGGAVANSRIALGGVAATPRRCGVAESTIKGQKVDQKLAELAGKS